LEEFTDSVLKAFKQIIGEIDKHSSEFDFRHRFLKYFVEGVLGYSGKEYQDEKNRTDITIYDENNFRAVIIETKKQSENLDNWREYSFKNADHSTRYVGLTNGNRFKVWERGTHKKDELICDVDFYSVFTQQNLDSVVKGKPRELKPEEHGGILQLIRLTKEELWNESKYSDFLSFWSEIDITEKGNFEILISKLDLIINLVFSNNILLLNEYQNEYQNYKIELTEINERLALAGKTQKISIISEIEREKRALEYKYPGVKISQGFDLWKQYSNREEDNENRNIEIFCKETAYVLTNKLLFIRICEDKGLIAPKISDGGIIKIKEMMLQPEESYKDIMEFAFKDAGKLYGHFYERGAILEWNLECDGRFNKVLQRALWLLNRFNFKDINRDIIGKIYEKYLPVEERKRLGEFYTPDEIIDYILDAIGYHSDRSIKGKTLIDPACGSGGFLVRAINRLIKCYQESDVPADQILEKVLSSIYGFDINPFACHVTEMNLLFQIIDLYKEAKKINPELKIDRFNIYQTDSLLVTPEEGAFFFYKEFQKYRKKQQEIKELKEKKFDFVVGNPPYVRLEKISTLRRHDYKNNYQSAIERFDLYMLFLEMAIRMTDEQGKVGFITSNKFLKTSTAKKLREIIAKNTTIEHLLNFGMTKVFEDATVDTVISILCKKPPSEYSELVYIDVKGDDPKVLVSALEQLKNKKLKLYEDELIKSFKVAQKSLMDGAPWRFVEPDEVEIMKHIDTIANNKLEDLVLANRLGVVTAANPIFIVNQSIISKYKLEKELLKPLTRGEEIRKWRVNWSGNYLLFPYSRTKKGLQLVDIIKFPNTYSYLEENKKELEERFCVKKNGKKWFELHDPVAQNVYELPLKIMCPDIAEESSFALDETGLYGMDSSFAIVLKEGIDPFFLLGVLNSDLIFQYFKYISQKLGSRAYRFKAFYTNEIPIRIPESAAEKIIAEKISGNVKLILEKNKEIANTESKLNDSSLILEGKEIVALADSNVKFPKDKQTIVDKTQMRIVGNQLFIDAFNPIICPSELYAKLLRIIILACPELESEQQFSKISKVINVPKNEKDIPIILEEFAKIKESQEKLPREVEKIESEINRLVEQLYNMKN